MHWLHEGHPGEQKNGAMPAVEIPQHTLLNANRVPRAANIQKPSELQSHTQISHLRPHSVLENWSFTFECHIPTKHPVLSSQATGLEECSGRYSCRPLTLLPLQVVWIFYALLRTNDLIFSNVNMNASMHAVIYPHTKLADVEFKLKRILLGNSSQLNIFSSKIDPPCS